MPTINDKSGYGRIGIGAWMAMARAPFHSVGILPFILGAVMAWRLEHAFRLDVLLLGILAVVAVMLATYFAGEYYDIVEDGLSAAPDKSKFAGGSGLIPSGAVPRRYPFIASRLSLAAAVILGLVIYFGLKTGPLTIPLGASGIICGYFYSAPPIRWVRRGMGELLIGFAYGWLPVASAFYLMAGRLRPAVTWVSIPVGLTIFNVILMNEFPDHDSDAAAGKRTLTVRAGKRAAAGVYAAAAAAFCVFFPLSIVKAGLPPLTWLTGAALPVLAIVVSVMALRQRYESKRTLELMCGLTIFINLALTLNYILAFWFGHG